VCPKVTQYFELSHNKLFPGLKKSWNKNGREVFMIKILGRGINHFFMIFISLFSSFKPSGIRCTYAVPVSNTSLLHIFIYKWTTLPLSGSDLRTIIVQLSSHTSGMMFSLNTFLNKWYGHIFELFFFFVASRITGKFKKIFSKNLSFCYNQT